MSEAQEYAGHLSEVIGPRPAGTEEEQQAAFFIEEILREQAKLSPEIEEFNCNPNYELPRVVCCIATVVLGILSIVLPLMVVPSLIITLITGILFILDALRIPIFSSFNNRGISQNVIAKYVPTPAKNIPEPQSNRSQRKRKVIVFAHYDNGKVRKEAKGALLNALPIIYWIEIAGMILVPVVLLIELVMNLPVNTVLPLTVLLIVGVVIDLLPILGYIIHQTAQYNRGANVNASGTGVLLELARRINVEIPAMVAEEAIMHGEDAILDSGLVPEGAELVYDLDGQGTGEIPDAFAMAGAGNATFASEAANGAAPNQAESIKRATRQLENTNNNYFSGDLPPKDLQTQQNDQMLTAVPTDNSAANNIGASQSVSLGATMGAAAGSAMGVATGSAVGTMVGSSVVQAQTKDEDDGAPEWYKKARQKAHKSAVDAAPAQRSRFADALDNATIQSANAIEQFEAGEDVASMQSQTGSSEAEQRLRKMRESMMGSMSASGSGVDGYLSQTTFAQDYEHSASIDIQTQRALEEQAARAAQAQAHGMQTDAQASSVAAAQTAEAAQNAAQQQAINERTLSFIPVEVDQTEIFAESSAAASGVSGAQYAGDDAEATLQSGGQKLGAAKSIDLPVRKDRRRRSISLPSLTGAIEGLEGGVQDAPLASDEGLDEQTKTENRQRRQERLASSLPHANADADMQAALDSLDVEEEESKPNVSTAGSFSAGASTAAFEPVGDELLDGVDEDDIYIDDADDSDYDLDFTSQGAPTGPGYVSMPKSRASRMFGRFRRKKKEAEETSLQDALGLDDNFDARSVGAARGGWESFRNDEMDVEDEWNGGAFSLGRNKGEDSGSGRGSGRSGRGNSSRGESSRSQSRNSQNRSRRGNHASTSFDNYDEDLEELEFIDPDIDTAYEEDFVGNEGDAYEDTDRGADREATRASGREGSKRGARGETRGESSSESRGEARSSRSSRGKSRRQGGATAARKHPDPAESVFGDLPLSLDAENNEREIIQKFTTGNINTEIWFVAIGSELANNAGMKNFIKQHKEELRGAIFLDLDGLGVGDLSVIEEEGLYLPVKINSRLKRYVTKASASLGLHVKNAKMRWRDSGAFIASKAGHPTLHIARMKDGKPAYAAQADDVFANLDEEMLKESSDFALEILRNI